MVVDKRVLNQETKIFFSKNVTSFTSKSKLVNVAVSGRNGHGWWR